MERSEFDFIEYPIRGLKVGKEWQYSGISLEEVQELRTPFLMAAFSLFSDFNVFEVLPHGKGTIDERSTVLSAIRILKEEENLWDAWEREKSQRS